MKTFQYTINEELGMHARAAGLVLQLAKEFRSSIVISNKGKSGDLKKLLSVIDLDIQYQDTVTVTVTGPDEDVAAEEMQAFLKKIFKLPVWSDRNKRTGPLGRVLFAGRMWTAAWKIRYTIQKL